MKTLVKFNKNLATVNVSNQEILDVAKSKELRNYLNAQIQYEEFCRNQTKKGQARKNERARARKRILNQSLNQESNNELIAIKEQIFKQKDAKIEKIEVEISYDGRKKSNLHQIIQGVRMAIFTGGLSPQYYDLGLIDFNILQ